MEAPTATIITSAHAGTRKIIKFSGSLLPDQARHKFRDDAVSKRARLRIITK